MSVSVPFSVDDRRRLRRALQATTEVREFRRLQAVLDVAEGSSVLEAARRAGVARTTVHRWLSTYRDGHHVATLADQPRAGRPRVADDLDERWWVRVLALDPRSIGYQATTWTVPLLRTYVWETQGLALSTETVRRRLHEGGWRWKRPRYVYHERAAHVAQKKGRLSAA